MPARKPGEEGVALLLVLWTVALMTVLGFSLAHGIDTQATIDRNQYDAAQAQALADTGVSLAILGVLERSADGAWRLDGSARKLAYADGSVIVRVQNEAGKIDLNRAEADLLANLFRTTGSDDDTAKALGDAIADWKRRRRAHWREPADEIAPNVSMGDVQPFLALEELQQVPGMTPEIYDRASPYLTVYSGSARVDPLSAPREVLLSLPGADAREVEAYVAARAEMGANPALLPVLDDVGAYLGGGLLAYVSILSEGRTPSHTRFIRQATVSLLGTGAARFRFVTWQQGRGAGQ